MIFVWEVIGVTWTLGKANSFSAQPKRGRGPHQHVEAAVDWCIMDLPLVELPSVIEKTVSCILTKPSKANGPRITRIACIPLTVHKFHHKRQDVRRILQKKCIAQFYVVSEQYILEMVFELIIEILAQAEQQFYKTSAQY